MKEHLSFTLARQPTEFKLFVPLHNKPVESAAAPAPEEADEEIAVEGAIEGHEQVGGDSIEIGAE